MVIVLSDCDSVRLRLWRLRVQSAHRRDDGGVGGQPSAVQYFRLRDSDAPENTCGPNKEKMKSKTPAWLRRRGYRHFDDVTNGIDAATLRFDPQQVARYAFFPFIGRDQKSRRYKKNERKVHSKPRPLRYAAHKDARIYAHYASILSEVYEAELERLGIGDCIVAYRRLPNQQSNIESAKSAFDFVRTAGACDVVTADVSSFFDTIDHEQLKSRWCHLLGVDWLPADHFAIFKQLTRYRWVDLDKLLGELGVKKASLSRESVPGRRGDRFTDFEDLRPVLKRPGVVTQHSSCFGIPQGSPASAVLSNIYMLDVDQQLSQFASTQRGFYRRYSDDILLAVPPGKLDAAEHQIRSSLMSAALESNPDKLSRHRFRLGESQAMTVDVPLEYLGFEFDGSRVLLRKKSLAKYFQRASRLIRQMYSAAKSRGASSMNRRRIYDRCTHIGSRNFITYAKRASRIFYPDATERTPIMRQLRRHTKVIENRIREAESNL